MGDRLKHLSQWRTPRDWSLSRGSTSPVLGGGKCYVVNRWDLVSALETTFVKVGKGINESMDPDGFTA